MRVLLLGGTGNLGSRLIPALLAHNHIITAFVRSPEKLQRLISPTLFEQITVFRGDALDSMAVAEAIRTHHCDAIMNTAGNQYPLQILGKAAASIIWTPTRMGKDRQPLTELGKIAASVCSAAIEVSKERQGRPIRMWLIGGISSLAYPGTDGQIQDFLPQWLAQLNAHWETEELMKSIPANELEWTLLCVGTMTAESKMIEPLLKPRGNDLMLAIGSPPDWKDRWIRHVPFGVYLNIWLVIWDYTTVLEDVADMIAEQLTRPDDEEYVACLVGMKQVRSKSKLK